MEVNYSKIVIDGLSENGKSKTPLESYFKREAKINERDNFIEFQDFFNGCMSVVKRYENDIKSQYDNEISIQDDAIRMLKAGNTINVKTPEEIELRVKGWEKQRQSIIDAGLNENYRCYITDKGDIVDRNNTEAKYYLWKTTIEVLKQGIGRARMELIPKHFYSEFKLNTGELISISKIIEPEMKTIQITSGATKKTKSPSKSFLNFLIRKDDDIIKKLHSLLDFHSRGKEIAKIFEALEGGGFLPKGARYVNSAITFFSIKCSNQSISQYLNKEYFNDEEKNQILDTFK